METTKKLSDAASLLQLLEVLTARLAGNSSSDPVPWAGIHLTLANARQLLEDVNLEIAQTLDFGQEDSYLFADDPADQENDQEEWGFSAPPSLADRIRKVPPAEQAHTVREVAAVRDQQGRGDLAKSTLSSLKDVKE